MAKLRFNAYPKWSVDEVEAEERDWHGHPVLNLSQFQERAEQYRLPDRYCLQIGFAGPSGSGQGGEDGLLNNLSVKGDEHGNVTRYERGCGVVALSSTARNDEDFIGQALADLLDNTSAQ